MRKDTYNENGTLFRYLIRTFQSNECGMTSQETTYAEDIWVDPIVYNVLGISSWEYLDENCSLMMSLHNASNSLVQTVENLRDNKKYSLDVLSNVWSHTENYGNVIQSTTMDEAGDINTFESFESTFQYNSSDYPSRPDRSGSEATIGESVRADSRETEATKPSFCLQKGRKNGLKKAI